MARYCAIIVTMRGTHWHNTVLMFYFDFANFKCNIDVSAILYTLSNISYNSNVGSPAKIDQIQTILLKPLYKLSIINATT